MTHSKPAPYHPMNPILAVTSVSKSFRSVQAVDDLSFDVQPGEIFALLGPNGAGKSTVVRMIVDIFRCDSGRLQFSETITNGGERADPRLMGYLPEERGLHRDTSVLSTLEYFGVLRGMGRADARREARQGLLDLDLGDREKDRIDALSKGNQQKVQFLAAFLHGPRFVVLDEPFSGLDPVNQQRFVDAIRRRRDEGCTILLSAHQMDLVEQMADRLLVMNRGRAVLHGTLDEIRRNTASGVRMELGISPDTDVAVLSGLPGVAGVHRPAQDRVAVSLQTDAKVGEVLNHITRSVTVTSVHSAAESLREIFIRTVGPDSPTAPEASE